MFKLIIILISSVVFVFCYVTELELPGHKCSLADSKCQFDFFEGIASRYAGTGLPQIGIPVIDPYALQNVSLTFLPFDVTLVEGESPGISTCRLLNYKSDFKAFTKKSEIICDKITIKGTYKLTPNPLVQVLTGKNIHGDGYIHMDLEGWYFKIEYPFEFVRHDDCKIYVKGKFDEAKYISEVRKSAKVTIDGFKVDDRDISNLFNDFFNKNWKTLMSQYAQPFHKKSMDFFFDTYGAFFDHVPATLYYSDDLTKYLKH